MDKTDKMNEPTISTDTLLFLAHLVQAQSVNVGAPDARQVTALAFTALDEIGAVLTARDTE